MFIRVYTNSPFRHEGEIACNVTEDLLPKLHMFQRVVVKTATGEHTALVYHIEDEGKLEGNPAGVLKRIIDPGPVINQEQYELSGRFASHYLISRADAIFTMIPSGRIYQSGEKEVDVGDRFNLPPLLPEQKVVFDQIMKQVDVGTKGANLKDLSVHLIHGITGSGKTRVYFELINSYLSRSLGVIFMIPEIALSYQFLESFRPLFGDKMAILHSGLGQKRRAGEYMRILSGEALVVVGTRSAIFAPVKDLGLVIIDEEHDQSYKEHASSGYHAKWVAHSRLTHKPQWLYRLRPTLVLGSATPSIETFYHAKRGQFFYHSLTTRATGFHTPTVHVPSYNAVSGQSDILSPFLVQKLREHLAKGNQAILILNRRGYSHYAFCRACEEAVLCRNCTSSMTYHKKGGVVELLVCHLCGYTEDYRNVCPRCGQRLTLLGKGIQKVEDALEFHFPDVEYARMDQDTVRTKGYSEDLLKAMREGKIGILIGTQMVAKGFDIPGVSLVGILNADIGLNLPDFRAAERVYQLLVQASGRAGRHQPGEVVMQTLQPGYYPVGFAIENNYEGFYAEEIALREKMGNPPFSRLLRIVVRGENEEALWNFAHRVAAAIAEMGGSNDLFSEDQPGLLPGTIYGPVEAPVYKVKNEFRIHWLIKGKTAAQIHDFAVKVKGVIEHQKKRYEGIRFTIDFDPIDLL